MLRRLDPTTDYRSLSKGFWPTTLPLGRRSVIYGHNGSGKSSFASLLLEIARRPPRQSDVGRRTGRESRCAGGQRRSVARNGGLHQGMGTPQPLSVPRSDTASPIVTLGEEPSKPRNRRSNSARKSPPSVLRRPRQARRARNQRPGQKSWRAQLRRASRFS